VLFTDERAEFVTDAEIIYTAEEDINVTDAVQREFAERVAFMAVYPFIRASIHGSATRLNVPAPVLGMVRQGEFSLGDQMDEETVEATFGDTRSELM
jgi:hypothetical protein